MLFTQAPVFRWMEVGAVGGVYRSVAGTSATQVAGNLFRPYYSGIVKWSGSAVNACQLVGR